MPSERKQAQRPTSRNTFITPFTRNDEFFLWQTAVLLLTTRQPCLDSNSRGIPTRFFRLKTRARGNRRRTFSALNTRERLNCPEPILCTPLRHKTPGPPKVPTHSPILRLRSLPEAASPLVVCNACAEILLSCVWCPRRMCTKPTCVRACARGGQGGACVPRMPHGCGVTLTTFFPGVADCVCAQR